jgi:hypothetical protein
LIQKTLIKEGQEMNNKSQQHKKRVDKAIDLVFSELGMEATPASELPLNHHSESNFNPEIAEQTGRMVSLALACYGNKEMAHRAIDWAFERMSDLQRPVDNSHVNQVFQTRVANALELHGIRTVRELCQFNRATLTAIGGFDMKTVLRIESELAEHGFSLRIGVGSE